MKQSFTQSPLTAIGLTENEQVIYKLLLRDGVLPARDITAAVKLKRTTIYRILDDLIDKKLIEKDESEPVVRFRVKHPLALKELASNRVEQMKEAEQILDTAMDAYISQYTSTQERPGVRYLEGIDGMKKVYSDIINSRKDVRIFASELARSRQDMSDLIDRAIVKQYKKGIKTRAIVARKLGPSQESINRNKKLSVDIHIIDDNRFKLPSQFYVYGDTLAITSLKKDILTTIIQNPDIAQSFKNIFDYIWDTSIDEHKKNFDQMPKFDSPHAAQKSSSKRIIEKMVKRKVEIQHQ